MRHRNREHERRVKITEITCMCPSPWHTYEMLAAGRGLKRIVSFSCMLETLHSKQIHQPALCRIVFEHDSETSWRNRKESQPLPPSHTSRRLHFSPVERTHQNNLHSSFFQSTNGGVSCMITSMSPFSNLPGLAAFGPKERALPQRTIIQIPIV